MASVVLSLMAGCAAVRVGYNNAPSLAYFALDRQFNFSEAQAEVVKLELRQMHAWHRSAELPEIAKLLQKAQGFAQQSQATPAQVCSLLDEMQPRWRAVVDRSLPAMVQVVVQASPEQLGDWQAEVDKRAAKFKRDYIDAKPADVVAKRLKSAQESYERIYGSLTEAQLAIVRSANERSSWDARASHRDMLRRHADGMQTTRQIVAAKLSADEAKPRMAALLARSTQSPDAAYRANIEQWQKEACATAAAVHNASTPEQRAKAVESLKGYEADVKALMR